jgi:hypothetical protein
MANRITRGQALVGSIKVGGGTLYRKIKTYTVTLSPALVGNATVAEQTFPVTGVLATDVVLSVVKPTAQAGLGIAGARVPSAGNVAISFVNPTAAGITPTAAEAYKITLASV